MAAVLCFALALAGCNGGTVDRHSLTNDSATIDSMACEGVALADGVARGRTLSTFVQTQADALRIQASNLANAFATRSVQAPLEARVRAKGREAARVAAVFARLHAHPGDRAVGRDVERTFKQIGGCA